MDISGELRGMLGEFAGRIPAGAEGIGAAVRMVAFPGELVERMPGLGLGEKAGRPVYGWLRLGLMMRMVPRVPRGFREVWKEELAGAAAEVIKGAQMAMALRGTGPVALLWHQWLLVAAQTYLDVNVPEVLVTGLWVRAFSGQAAAGHLHALTAGTPLDVFVYDEFCALHAAFNSVAVTGRLELLEPLERVVRWHVENTQADYTTHEPWGVAAFAALDGTGTFAPQMLHHARTQLTGGTNAGAGLETLALLADALLTQEVSYE